MQVFWTAIKLITEFGLGREGFFQTERVIQKPKGTTSPNIVSL